MRLRIRSLATLLIFGFGCAPALQVTRLKHAPSKPENCELKFDYGSPMEAMKWMNSYDQVGAIGAGSLGKIPDEWTDKLKREIQPHACRLGADVVVMMAGSTFSGGGSNASFFLYRKLDAAEAPKSPAPSSTPTMSL
jgi:hypothetical protein